MKTKIGDLLADCGKQPGQERRNYIKIGIAFQDGERIVLKIDSLPIPGSGWGGWVNIFADKHQRSEPPLDDSDIPF